jgi:predicted acetyltransferase
MWMAVLRLRSIRWVPGTEELPSYVLGHIGYSVVPWKQCRGYATQAVRALLPEARARGLRYLEITTDPDNIASQRVILGAGGVLIGRFAEPPQYGGHEGLRFRIDL